MDSANPRTPAARRHSPLQRPCAPIARSIGWAVAAVGRTRPCEGHVCLPQAIAAHQMLKRRGIPSTLLLGVAHEDSKMIAHAWVTVGDLIVTGAAAFPRAVYGRVEAEPRSFGGR